MINHQTCKCGAVFQYETPDWAPDLGGPEVCEKCGFEANRRAVIDSRMARIRAEIADSGIPERYHHHDQARDHERIAHRAECLVNRNIFLSGMNGVGKTHNLSHAAYLAILDGAKGVRWIFMPEWLSYVCAMLGKDAWIARSVIGHTEQASLLVIDDLGKEKETERSGEILFCLLDCRLRSGRPTWITSNLSGAEIEAKYGPDRGPAIRSRLLREDFQTLMSGGEQ